jgi:hypothetical protein
MVMTVLIVLAALASWLVLPTFLNPNRTYNQQLLSQCNVSWPPELPQNVSQRQQFAVLLFQPNSTAKICVGYHSLSSSSVTLSLKAQVTLVNGTGGMILLSSEPTNLSVPGNNNNISPVGTAFAVFTITSANDSRGFYVLNLPGFCPTIPIAVGYSASEVNATMFSGWLAGRYSCGPESRVVTGGYVSFLNVNIAYPYTY